VDLFNQSKAKLRKKDEGRSLRPYDGDDDQELSIIGSTKVKDSNMFA